MMKPPTRFLFVVLFVTFSLSILGSGQVFGRSTMSVTQVKLSEATSILKVFEKQVGRWPGSWAEVDGHFDLSVWESRRVHDEITQTYVLLPEISGRITARSSGGYTYDSTLLMVMSSPVTRSTAFSSNELGRWALWRTKSNSISTMWHPEEEIKAFSAWPAVQHEIDIHNSRLKENLGSSLNTNQGANLPESDLIESKARGSLSFKSIGDWRALWQKKVPYLGVAIAMAAAVLIIYLFRRFKK
ncbi:MAG: hypothetical protein OJI67_24205 [Prosthecobacter sp.]|nr:hypothetical protein [Prosthecobacter sp.]